MEYITIYVFILLFTLELQTYKITALIIDDKHNLIFTDIKPMHRINLIKDFIEKNNKIVPEMRRKATIERFSLFSNKIEKQYDNVLKSLPQPPKIKPNVIGNRSNTDSKVMERRLDLKYYDTESKMKTKLLAMMDGVFRYSDFMLNKVILVKDKLKHKETFEMGMISMNIFGIYDNIVDIARTMDSLFTEWSAMEHIDGYYSIHKMSQEIMNLTSKLTRLTEGGQEKELNPDNLNFDEFPGSNQFLGGRRLSRLAQRKRSVTRKSKSIDDDRPYKISLNLFLDPSRSNRSQSSWPGFL